MHEITSTGEFRDKAASGKIVIFYMAGWYKPSVEMKQRLEENKDWFEAKGIEVLCLDQDNKALKKIFANRGIIAVPCIEAFEDRKLKGKYEGVLHGSLLYLIEKWYESNDLHGNQDSQNNQNNLI